MNIYSYDFKFHMDIYEYKKWYDSREILKSQLIHILHEKLLEIQRVSNPYTGN